MSEDYKLQLSYKFGVSNDMLNIRANDPVELNAYLDGIDIAKLVEFGTHLIAAGNVVAVNPDTTPPVQSGWQAPAGAPQGAQPPAWATGAPAQAWTPPATAQPVQTGAGQPANQMFCEHGPRVFKSGTKKNGEPYALWSCPLPQPKNANMPAQCAPIWVND